MTKLSLPLNYDHSSAPLAYNKEQVLQYLKRINYYQSNENELPEPTLETLNQIMTMHLHSIPYGNTSNFYYTTLKEKDPLQKLPTYPNNPLCTRGVSMHPMDIFHKLIIQRRDGYCYEHNYLFFDILLSIGYKAYTIAARSVDQNLFFKEREIQMTGLRHCAIIVFLNNQKYLVDVGFNKIGNFQAVPIIDELLENNDYPMVLLPDSTKLQVIRCYPPGQAQLKEIVPPFYLAQSLIPAFRLDETLTNKPEGSDQVWHPLFFFTLEPFMLADISHINYYVVLDLTSTFNEHLIVRKVLENSNNTVVRLFDNQLKLIYNDGRVERILLKDEKDRRNALLKYFGVDLSCYDEHLPPTFVSFQQ